MTSRARVLRWGILSTAKIARQKVVPGMQAAPSCEVVAIGGRDPATTAATAEALGIPTAHPSLEAVLDDPAVDAVYVPLPNHLHAEWTIAAARAGKHVLCEKPLALTASDAERMVEACKDAGVALMEAFMYRLHPSWLAVQELLAAGRIGTLTTVQSWFSYFNDDPTNIRNVAAYGGGALYDIGCYLVNLSRLLFGAEPERVASSIVHDPTTGVDTTTSGLLEFGSGRTATFTCATRVEPDQRVHVYGTHGRISIEIPFNIPPDRPTRVFVTSGGQPPVAPATETVTLATANPYTCEAEAFARAVLDGDPVPIPPTDGVANVRVLERLLAASR